MHNILSSGSSQEELNGKLRRKLDPFLKVNKRCLEGFYPPGQGAAAICGVREIAVYPSPAQLQDSFRVPRVFRGSGSGIRNMKLRELAYVMDLPQ